MVPAPARPSTHEVFVLIVVEVGCGGGTSSGIPLVCCFPFASSIALERVRATSFPHQRAREPPVNMHVLDHRASEQLCLQ